MPEHGENIFGPAHWRGLRRQSRRLAIEGNGGGDRPKRDGIHDAAETPRPIQALSMGFWTFRVFWAHSCAGEKGLG
ncbi:Peptidase M20 (plasmid) [Mesorhizobium loti]|nr:Peptidase M20 [Mesorhizobium loti]